MKIWIGSDETTNYADWYSQSSGALNISDNFDKTSRSMSASFTLIDPDTIPKAFQMVRIYVPDDATAPVFSGVIKSVTKTIVASHPVKANAAVYEITADSWELGSSNIELITYQAYYAQTLSYIIADIVDKYMPHIDDSEVAITDDPVFSQVIFVQRKPTEAISALCQKVGKHWWIDSNRKMYIATLGDGSYESPFTVNHESKQLNAVNLELATDVDGIINDLYLRSGILQYSPVQDVLSVNGFDGDYRLSNTPFGMETVIPILDEFAGGDTPADPDDTIWYNLGDSSTQFHTQTGRLQVEAGTGTAALVSRSVVSTDSIFRARDLEIEIIGMNPGGYFAMGLRAGVTDPSETPDSADILIGFKIDSAGKLYTIAAGVATDSGYTVEFGVGKAYQLKILYLKDGQYLLYIQGEAFGVLGSKQFFEVGYGLYPGLPKYVAFCPILTSGGVTEATVIQGAVLVDPAISTWLQEMAYVTRFEEDGGVVYLVNEFANWDKWKLEGLPIALYDAAGTEYTEYLGDDILVLSNETQRLTFYPSIPLSWFTANGIVNYKMDWRKVMVSTKESNDYETHAYIEVVEETPLLRFYAGEIPTGVIQINYDAEAVKTVRMTDETSVSYIAGISGIPSDTGHRAGYQEADGTIRTYTDLIQLAKTILQAQSYNFVQGSFQTDTYKLNYYETGSWPDDVYLASGMDQAISITVGSEAISATSYLSSVTMNDVGGGVFSLAVSLGNYKEYIHTLFLAKLATLYKDGLSIDDTSTNEHVSPNAIALSEADTVVGTPTVTQSWFDDDGLHLRWYSSDTGGSGSTDFKTELRLDERPGSNDSKCKVYQGTYTAGYYTFDIAQASIDLRRYVFYIYDIDTSGNYSRIPQVVTLENSQPVPTPFLDIRLTDDETCKIILSKPLEHDIKSRKIYVNSEYTSDDKLDDSDRIYSLSPYDTVVEFPVYTDTLYITLVDEDIYSDIDSRPNRFNRVMDTDVVAAPPHEPIALSALGAYEDSTIAPNTLKLNINIPAEANYGDPEWLHIEFCSTTGTGSSYDPFPDIIPVVEGVSDGELETANAEYILVPKTYDLSAVVIGQLLVINHPSGHGYQCRFIESITLNYDASHHKIDITTSFILDQDDDYDWEVWPLWYEDPLIESYVDIPITSSNVSFTGGVYQVTLSHSPFNGYVRVFPGNRHGLADSAICGSTITIYGTLDTGVPSKPLNVIAWADGMNLVVTWEKPLLNTHTLQYYTIYLSRTFYTDEGGGDYSMTSTWTVNSSLGVLKATIPVQWEYTWYYIGVTATNIIGESELAIFGLDA